MLASEAQSDRSGMSPPSNAPSRPRPARRAYSAVRIIPLAVGLMMALALLPVIILGYTGAAGNTGRLLTQNRDLVLDGLEQQLRSTLDGAAARMAVVGRMIVAGDIDPADRAGFSRFMAGVTQGDGSIVSVAWLEETGPVRRWVRDSVGEESHGREVIREVEAVWRKAVLVRQAHWNNPVISRMLGEAVIPHVQPVERDGRLLGVIVTVLTSQSITPLFDRMESDITPFVLVGRDRVLVHRNIRMNVTAMEDRLPRLDEVDDPILAAIWRDQRRPSQDVPGRSLVHWGWIGDGYSAQVFSYRSLEGYGTEPWLVGFHQSSLASFRERWVIQGLLWGSLALFLVAVAAAYLLAGRVVRPAGDIAEAARAMERLDFEQALKPASSASRVAEVRDISQALARTASALMRFETYMPKALVRQLLAMDAAAGEATDRDVTVLFMDLAGYTAYSDGRSAREVATYLNGVFAAVGPIVEAGGGTIDKYTGDGLMAVWGVPVADADHVRRALATALTILERLTPIIAGQAAKDPATCRMRIGLHTGRVLAGDLGFAGRTDYTIVGRTVNIAQRCQAALKDRMGDAPVALAITEAVRAAAGLPMDGLAPIPPARDEPAYRVLWLSPAADAVLRRGGVEAAAAG